MSLREQQNLLAKLYADAEFRRDFLSQPEKNAVGFDLTEREITDLAAIMPEELNFFADSLFGKRLRETEKFLPLTKKALGEDFTAFFRRFSQHFKPQTVKKHFEDALHFCRYLREQNISAFARDAAKFEQSKLEFFGLERRMVVCRLDFDVREFIDSDARRNPQIPERKKKIAIWIRFGKRIKHYFI